MRALEPDTLSAMKGRSLVQLVWWQGRAKTDANEQRSGMKELEPQLEMLMKCMDDMRGPISLEVGSKSTRGMTQSILLRAATT